MTFETFEKLLANMRADSERKQALYKLGIDMFDTDASIVAALGIEAFGKDNWNWIEWYLFERKDSVHPQAWDSDKNPICYDVPSLFKFVSEKDS